MAEVRLKAGVFGTGALGRHHVRILSQMEGVDCVGLFDANPEVAASIGAEHGVRVFPSFESLARELEVAILAVPTVDHARLGVELLQRGCHLLVEKPIAASLEEADSLVAAARAAGRVLAVGHVEYYNPAVQRLLDQSEGAPRFLEVERLGVFSPRSLDVDVVLDLMIHDLQILHTLDPTPVREIRATGIDVLSPRIDLATVRLEMESGCVANLAASRVSFERARKLRAIYPSTYFSLDYQAQEIKGYRLHREDSGPRIEPLELAVEKAEPLVREQEAFLAACRGQAGRFVDGVEGRRALATALEILDAIQG
ncbi:MAG: Gfo/Idh/MocA family oxidoreductase [Thermoanaerobaculia bacterium]|nr:Gfo/Idh/MocA family oxidoreductase [Thermoanaerobaculia bacterium]